MGLQQQRTLITSFTVSNTCAHLEAPKKLGQALPCVLAVLRTAPLPAHLRCVISGDVALCAQIEWDSKPPSFHLNNFHVHPEVEGYVPGSFTHLFWQHSLSLWWGREGSCCMVLSALLPLTCPPALQQHWQTLEACQTAQRDLGSSPSRLLHGKISCSPSLVAQLLTNLPDKVDLFPSQTKNYITGHRRVGKALVFCWSCY